MGVKELAGKSASDLPACDFRGPLVYPRGYIKTQQDLIQKLGIGVLKTAQEDACRHPSIGSSTILFPGLACAELISLGKCPRGQSVPPQVKKKFTLQE